MRDVDGGAGCALLIAGCAVSESQVASVREYIRGQEEHHSRQSFQEEFVALLERHGVEYDDRYLWN